MAEVMYDGPMPDLTYGSAPSREPYLFIKGTWTAIKDEDKEFFRGHAQAPGTPFQYRESLADIAKDTVEDVVDRVRGTVKPKGGRK